MPSNPQPNRELLDQLPSITELLKTERVAHWLEHQPSALVTHCLRGAVNRLREQILADDAGRCGARHVSVEAVLSQAEARLREATAPHLRHAVNATGIILHTGLGRAVLPGTVVDSMLPELKGYCTLAVDRRSGERRERDELVEYLLTELTGAEAATVVNNNAAATMLTLAALAAAREVMVSRGQLIEIGGSFRLPEVMAQSGARLVEVGATNRTHLKDYRQAITPNTAAILRVHPSNYRIVGFTAEPELRDLAELAHAHDLLLLDDLGAGALVDLARFGLPHEPTVGESIAAGADVVLFSGDKLIGAAQSGVIVGRQALLRRLREHPLMRAVRVDKTCLLALERTLQLFRRPETLPDTHPTYRMLTTRRAELEQRARRLIQALAAVPGLSCSLAESTAYVGSGSLPAEAIPSLAVTVTVDGRSADELARRLRLDDACVFGRIAGDMLHLDLRTITDEQVALIAAALGRVLGSRHGQSRVW
jgi:L-seryl-tRNA(Ser) seleniumtransferase